MRVRVSSPALRKLDGLIFDGRIGRRYQLYFSRRRSQVGKARVCKTPITGSSPVVASRITKHPRKRGVFLVGSRVLHAVCFAIPVVASRITKNPRKRGVFFVGSRVLHAVGFAERCVLRVTLWASHSRRRLKNYQTPRKRGVFLVGSRVLHAVCFASRCGLSDSDIIAALCI